MHKNRQKYTGGGEQCEYGINVHKLFNIFCQH